MQVYDIYRTQKCAILLRVYDHDKTTDQKIAYYLRMELNPIRAHENWDNWPKYREHYKNTHEYQISRWKHTPREDSPNSYSHDGYLCKGSFEKCTNYIFNYAHDLTIKNNKKTQKEQT